MEGYRPALQGHIDAGASPEQSVQLTLNDLGVQAMTFSEDDIGGLRYLASTLSPSATTTPEETQKAGGLFGFIKDLFTKKKTEPIQDKEKVPTISEAFEGYKPPEPFSFFNNLFQE